LARVKVDLPAALDSMFKLYVTKSSLDPSPNFLQQLKLATSDGITFANYIEQAEATYRKQKTKDGARFPVVPGNGLTVNAQKAIATMLLEKGTAKPKKVTFKWAQLDLDVIFRLDIEKYEIYLNAIYKKHLVEGTRRDAPVLKLLLMFLFKDEFDKSFMSKKSLDWIQRVNQALLASLKE
jgi:hypothetical protein